LSIRFPEMTAARQTAAAEPLGGNGKRRARQYVAAGACHSRIRWQVLHALEPARCPR
jgi:hypothetical protein